MKSLSLLCALIFLISCQSKLPKNSDSISKIPDVKKLCNENYDSVLVKYAKDFKSTYFELSKNLSPELNSFLLQVDTTCLRQQKEYRFFIATILAKLYYYHIVNAHQGYDLQLMEIGGSKVIVEEFKKMAGLDKRRYEILNSDNVVCFIQKDAILSEDTTLKSILKQINAEWDLIDKQNKAKIIKH